MFTFCGRKSYRNPRSDGTRRRDFMKNASAGFTLQELLPVIAAKQIDVVHFNNHAISQNTGKRPSGTCTAVTVAASPQVIGNGDSSGGGDAGGEEGGDGDGDGEPPITVSSGETPPSHNWFIRLLLWLFSLILTLYNRLPDFPTVIQSFDVVFPDGIRDNIFAPSAQRLLDEIATDIDEGLAKVLWQGLWRRVRFADLIIACFLSWIARLLRHLWNAAF